MSVIDVDNLVAAVRTAAQAGWGFLAAYLATKWGVVVDEETNSAVVFTIGLLASGAITGGVARLSEQYPWLQYVFIVPKKPSY